MKMIGPFWVYTHTTPDGMVYVGRSGLKYTYDRWKPSHYKNTTLEPYIEKWGWENISHFFIDGLSKEESYKLEGELSNMYKEKGVCINKYISCGLRCNGEDNGYHKKYRDEHEEFRNKANEYNKRYHKEHREEIYLRKKKYREEHREEINAKNRERYKKKKESRI